MLASMTAGSKHMDSTKNVLKPCCVERWSISQARRDLTEFVASYTCQSFTTTHLSLIINTPVNHYSHQHTPVNHSQQHSCHSSTHLSIIIHINTHLSIIIHINTHTCQSSSTHLSIIHINTPVTHHQHICQSLFTSTHTCQSSSTHLSIIHINTHTPVNHHAHSHTQLIVLEYCNVIHIPSIALTFVHTDNKWNKPVGRSVTDRHTDR